MNVRRWVEGVAVALAAACAVLLSLSAPFDRFDETWYLQVVRRVHAGEVLYRDVFYGATPLALDVSRGIAVVFGAEAGVLRAALAACFAAIVLAAVAVARRLGIGSAGLALVALGTLAYGQLLAARTSFYSPLAVLLGLVTLWLALAEPGRRATLAAGAAAGLAFAAKQNVGLLLVAALWACVVARPAGSRSGLRAVARRLALVSAAFVASAAAPLVPVLLTGGGPKLVEYGFLAKDDYLRVAGVPYWDGVRRSVTVALAARGPADAKWAHGELMFLLPLAAVVALVVAWLVGREQRATTWTLAAFVAAALLSTLPRCDAAHLAASVPVLMVAGAWALHLVARDRGRVASIVTAGAIAWMALGTGADVVGAVERLKSPRSTPVPFPPFRGTHAEVASVRTLGLRVEALRAMVPADASPFLVSPAAAFYYLGSGLRNPTPFDYPYVTALGSAGEAGIVEGLRAGRITWLCIDVADSRRLRNPLWPNGLERHARENMRLVAAREDWELYRSR